jgi:hypothetical protein
MNKQRVKIREYGEQQLEALGFDSKIEFELEDGSVIELVHPWLWSDEVLTAYQAEQADDDAKEPKDIRLARAVLGKINHAKFIKAGGTSRQIVLALDLMNRPNPAEDESDPKD